MILKQFIRYLNTDSRANIDDSVLSNIFFELFNMKKSFQILIFVLKNTWIIKDSNKNSLSQGFPDLSGGSFYQEEKWRVQYFGCCLGSVDSYEKCLRYAKLKDKNFSSKWNRMFVKKISFHLQFCTFIKQIFWRILHLPQFKSQILNRKIHSWFSQMPYKILVMSNTQKKKIFSYKFCYNNAIMCLHNTFKNNFFVICLMESSSIWVRLVYWRFFRCSFQVHRQTHYKWGKSTKNEKFCNQKSSWGERNRIIW